MSYDLQFYRKKNEAVSKETIETYLNTNLVSIDAGNTQWFFENPDTEVYFTIEYHDPDPEDAEFQDSFEEFEDTNFSFNLNFSRPTFFGIEAFGFVARFCNDLNLYVLNFQTDAELPYQPNYEQELAVWDKSNRWASQKFFEENQNSFLDQAQSNQIWEYNFNRENLQQRLGGEYFVPKIFFFRIKGTQQTITISSWAENMPILLPPSDYFLLTRLRKKWFSTVTENALVSREKLLSHLGSHFEEFDFKDCKIIHPEQASQIKAVFDSIKAEKDLPQFAERIAMQNLSNVNSD